MLSDVPLRDDCRWVILRLLDYRPSWNGNEQMLNTCSSERYRSLKIYLATNAELSNGFLLGLLARRT